MKKVVHLIPFDGIGGVESAAQTMNNVSIANIEFEIFYIFKKQVSKINFLSSLSLKRILLSVFQLYKKKPDLVIVSLWRSCIVAILFKIIRPKTKIVLFLHYPHHYHLADMFFTKIALFICDSVWADSSDTLHSRAPGYPHEKSDVISFIARRFNANEHIDVPMPNFIFWGRLHEQKCIHRAIEIFASIKSHYKYATYTLIGPDGGELSSLIQQVEKLGIKNAVKFLGPKDLEAIIDLSKDTSFYLQTSKLEGMAMSVVEAMQLGIIPIVTPVGEIKNYCVNGVNSILISDNNSAVSAVHDLLNNTNLFLEIRNNCIKKWQNHEIYSESVIRAAKKILKIDN